MKKHNNNTKNPDTTNTNSNTTNNTSNANTNTFNGNSVESNFNINNLNGILPLLANIQSNNSSMISNSNPNINELLLNLLLNNNKNNNILHSHAFNNGYLSNNNSNDNRNNNSYCNSILSNPSVNLNKFLSCQQQKASLIKAMNNTLENNNFLFKNSILALEQDYNTRASSIKCCYDDLLYKIDAEINRTQSELINEFRLFENISTNNFSTNVNNMNQLHIPNNYTSNNSEQSSLLSNNLLLSLLNNHNNNLSSNNNNNTNTSSNTSNSINNISDINDIKGNKDLNAILDRTKVNGVSNTKPSYSNNLKNNNINSKLINNDNYKSINDNNDNNNNTSFIYHKIRNYSSNTRSKTKLPNNSNNNSNNNIKSINNINSNNNFHNNNQNHSKTKTNKKSKSLTNVKESTIKTNSKLKQINKYNNNSSKHSRKMINNIPKEDDFDDIDDFFDKSQKSLPKLSSNKYFSKKIGNSTSDKNKYDNFIDDDFDFSNDKEENKFDELFKPANEITSQLNVGGNEVEDLDDCFNVGIGKKKKKINVSNEILDDYYNKLFGEGEEIIETKTKEKMNSKGINGEESKENKDSKEIKDDDEKKMEVDNNNVIKSSCFNSLNNNKIESIKEESESINESNIKNKNGNNNNNRESQEIDKKNNESVLASLNKDFLLTSSSKKSLKRRTCDINSIYNTTNTNNSSILNNAKTFNYSNIKENSDSNFINTAISVSNVKLKHKHELENENTFNSKVFNSINTDVDNKNTNKSIKKEDDGKSAFSESDNNDSNNSNEESGNVRTKNIFKTKNKLTINKESSSKISKISNDSNDSNSINMSLIDSKKSVYNESKILLDDILIKKDNDEVIIKNNSTKINAQLFIENKYNRFTKELRYEEIDELEFLCICYYQDKINPSTSSNVSKSIIRNTDKAVINNNSICYYCKKTYIISLKTTNMKDCFIQYLTNIKYEDSKNIGNDIIDTSEEEAINKLILYLSKIDFAFYYTITIWKLYISFYKAKRDGNDGISSKSNTDVDNQNDEMNLTIISIFSLLKNTLICIYNKEELSEEAYKRSSLICFKYYNSGSTVLVYIIKISKHAFENKIIDLLLSDGYLVLEISDILSFNKTVYDDIVNNIVRVGDQIEVVLSESKRNSITEKFII